MLWVYELPTWLLGALIVGVFTLLSVAGLYATRGIIRRILGPPPGHNQGVDTYVQASVIFYGLIAGLLAVGVWEQYASIDDKVSQEASSLAALYRDARSYPQPYRSKLESEIRVYAKYLISVAWPQQSKGIVPTQGVALVNAIEDTLYAFQPKTTSQSIVATSTIDEFNRYVELRRSRLHAVTAGLPAPMWAVLIIDAVITVIFTYFLGLERWRAHVAMTTLTAVIISLLLFMIAMVDHPFQGGVRVGPGAFELIYKELMVPSGTGP
jgi:hypothetical protein